MKETALYQPIKDFLEAQSYEVKAEVMGCDLVAVRAKEPPVIVELKLGFSVSLLLQGVDRLAISDSVYVAIPRGKGKRFQSQIKDGVKLCRRLGLGLLSVRARDGFVQAHCDPTPYAPRKNARRRSALLKEFAARQGDPNIGGQVGRTIVTAYRQDVMRIAGLIAERGPQRPRDLVSELGIAKAPSILQKDYYGWFVRVERGVYGLSDAGVLAVKT